VAGYERALDPLGTWCRMSTATGTQPIAECRRLDEDARAFRKIPLSIGAWSEALAAMAEDRNARSFGGDVAQLTQLAWPQGASHVGAAVDALARLFTSSYRRSALAKSLRQAGPHLATLIEFARGIVKLSRERLDTLEEQSGKVSQSLTQQTPSEVAERIALVAVQAQLASAREHLGEYDQALAAFGAAHARLAAAAERLTSDDAEVYLEILSDLKGIYKRE
jgi:hypothetical protein